MEIELKYLVDSKETIEKIFSDGYLCEIKDQKTEEGTGDIRCIL